MKCHDERHHRACAEGASGALENLAEARRSGDQTHVAALERELAFNVSGHVLHSMFWQNLSPEGGGEADGILSAAIRQDFGGFDLMKKQLVKAAASIMGSGWGALVWEP